MSKLSKKRIISGILAIGMIVSSVGAVPAFADEGEALASESGYEETSEVQSEENTTISNESDEDTTINSESEEDTAVSNESEEDSTSEADAESDVTTDDETQDGDSEENSEETEDDTDTDEESEDDGTIETIVGDFGGDVKPFYFNGVSVDEENVQYIMPINSYPTDKSEYASTDGYEGLTTNQKLAYDALYSAMVKIDESSSVSYSSSGSYSYSDDDYDETIWYFDSVTVPTGSATTDDIFKVYCAILYDNPQLFWLGHGVSYTYGASTGYIYEVRFGTEVQAYATGSGRYAAKQKLFTVVEDVLSDAELFANDYSKMWYVHDYICRNTIYDPYIDESGENPRDHDVTGLFLDGVCVCEAYAKSMQLLLNALDIDVLYVVGVAGSSSSGYGGHAWNQVAFDGEWYNLDATWNDLTPEGSAYYKTYWNYLSDDTKALLQRDDDGYVPYSYVYFNITDTTEDFTTSHLAFYYYEQMYDTNTCTSTTYSYANHDQNFSAGNAKYTLYDGSTTKYVSTLNAAVSIINSNRNSRTAYTIEYVGEDENDAVDADIAITYAKSVTFESESEITFNGSFSSSCAVTFDAPAVFGGTFKASTVYANDSLAFLGTAAVTTLTAGENAELRIGESANVSITGKVTVSSGKINIIPVDDSGNVITATNGKTYITAKSASVDSFKSSYTIDETDYDYTVYKSGTEIKLSLPIIKVTYDNEGESIDYSSYITLSDAFTAINKDTSLVGKTITITLLDDVTTTKVTFPTKVAKLIIDGGNSDGDNYTLTFDKTTALSAAVDLELSDITIAASNAKSLALTVTKNLTVDNAEFDSSVPITIKGSANGKITLLAEDDSTVYIPCDISGFGNMVLPSNAVVINGNIVNVTTLTMDGTTLNMNTGSGNASVTVKNLNGSGTIYYASSAVIPMTISTSANGEFTVSAENCFSNEQKIFKATSVDVGMFTLDGDKIPNDDSEYTLSKSGSYLVVRKVGFYLSDGSDATKKYALWSDVTSAINDKTKDYTIAISGDVQVINASGIISALTMPKAKTYNSLTITSDSSSTLSFLGNVTLTGNTTFKNIKLESLKKVKTEYAAYAFNITAGSYELTLEDVSSEGILTNVTSSGVLNLNDTAVYGKLTAKQLNVIGSSAIYGSVSVTGISADENAVLTVNNGQKIAIGKNGFSTDSSVLTIKVVTHTSESDEEVEISAGKTIATISGVYEDQVTVGDGIKVVKSTQNLITVSESDALKVAKDSKNIYYASFEDAVKDISSTGSGEAYIIYFADETAISKFTLPTANKYSSLTFAANDDKAVITVLTDLTLTGELIISDSVTINKVKNSVVIPLNITCGKYSLTVKGKISPNEEVMSQVGKLSMSVANTADFGENDIIFSGAVSASKGTLKADDITLTSAASMNVAYLTCGTLTYPLKIASKISGISFNINKLNPTDGTIAKNTLLIKQVTTSFTCENGIEGSSYVPVLSGKKVVASESTV
ncbi:MAG: hypothetical protein LUI05_02910 [Oscillospiraceae bacterium]|nr:hypothetical protein [Oscillospiraceae bacterium]